MTPVVEISTTGRGGTITYREGEHAIAFDWEFATSPALALMWGPSSGDWDAKHAWARGRQAAIYDFVCTEVVRQQSPDGGFEYDLDRGEITILTATGARARRSPRSAST